MTDFLARLAEAPDDDDARRVSADALEEQGHAEQGEYLRLELQWSALAPERPTGWSTVLVRESVSVVTTLVKELNALEPGLALARRSACFFDWPVGLA